MMWLSWRQFRAQAFVAAAALVLALITVAATRPGLASLYDSTVALCAPPADCTRVVHDFLASYPAVQSLEIVLLVVPALIGIFWGAPLVARELETGTYRLAWTQSVTRSRWLGVKLLVVGLASVAVTGLLGLMISWWSGPLDLLRDDRFSPIAFSERGIVSLGYAAFGFVLGATAGLLIKRTLPAMATTLVVFITVRVAVTVWIRPHFLSQVQDIRTLDPQSIGYGSFSTGVRSWQATGRGDTLQPGSANLPDAWVFSNQIVDNASRPLTPEFVAHACPLLSPSSASVDGEGVVVIPNPTAAFEKLHDCVTKVGASYHQVITYQPADRYWLFQGMETTLFTCLALVLAGLSFWWIRRRLT